MMYHRPVTAQDLPLLCTFPQNEGELFYFFPTAQYPLTPEQLSRTIAQRAAPTVVEDGGQVVAFADLFRLKNSHYTNIGNVMVAPEVRGRGVGQYLIKQMIATARTTFGARRVRVSCFNHNTPGLLLYARLGFVPYALEERVDWQGQRVALIHLRMTLKS
ncbi:MAG: N-acetyltransferase family protein [Desulfobulbus sp.]